MESVIAGSGVPHPLCSILTAAHGHVPNGPNMTLRSIQTPNLSDPARRDVMRPGPVGRASVASGTDDGANSRGHSKAPQ